MCAHYHEHQVRWCVDCVGASSGGGGGGPLYCLLCCYYYGKCKLAQVAVGSYFVMVGKGSAKIRVRVGCYTTII